MTFQTTKIQALIAEIDAVLSKDSKSRFGWLVGDGNADRQMLERVRQHLQKWQEQLTIVQATGGEAQVAEITSYQILFEQADAESDRLLLSESLQTDIASMQQQRQALLNEIQQLQQQRKALIDPQVLLFERQEIVTKFSQSLINRLQEIVNQQLAETIEKIQAVELPNEDVETSLKQKTESPKLEFIELEKTVINPQLELITASVEPLPYAGVELTTTISDKIEITDLIPLQLKENDTISALTDLIKNPNVTTASPDLIEGTGVIPALTNLIENAPKTTALLEEDLLTNELAEPTPKVDIWLGNNIVEQLNEDFSDVEGVEQPDVQPPEVIIEPINDATDSIDLDLAAAVEQEQEKINAAIPEHILAEFEDLFGDSSNSSIAVINPELKPEETPESVTNQESLESEKKN